MKTNIRFLLITSLALLIFGCASRAPVTLKNKFDTELHKPYLQNGTAILKGQAFLRQRAGGVVTCAGSEVFLIPSTPYFREAISLLLSGKTLANTIDKSYKKDSQCDAQGNFVFNNIPNGRWMIITKVEWQAGKYTQGGALLKEITINNEPLYQVLLSDESAVN